MKTSLRKYLEHEKQKILSISQIKFLGYNMDDCEIDFSGQVEHHQMIRTIYRFLTNKKYCLTIGSQWQTIGFQGTDPKTDIRGSGMLGVLNIL